MPYLFLGFLAFCCLLTLFFHLRTAVPPFPSSKREIQSVLKLINLAKIPKGQTLFELGSGWGNLAISLAKNFPENPVMGYEISPIPYLISKIRSCRYHNLKIKRKNFFKENISEAGAICSYLMRAPMLKLGEKLDLEIQIGTPVVTVAFYFPERTPSAIIRRKGILQADVALYYWKGDPNAKIVAQRTQTATLKT